jgi:hypothetical protein
MLLQKRRTKSIMGEVSSLQALADELKRITAELNEVVAELATEADNA